MTCAQISLWILTLSDRSAAVPLSGGIVGHLNRCSTCRGRVRRLLTDLAGGTVSTQTCDDALDDLPALIDLEQSDGTLAAARLLPTVWWHRLTCTECFNHAMLLSSAARLPHEDHPHVPDYGDNRPPTADRPDC